MIQGECAVPGAAAATRYAVARIFRPQRLARRSGAVAVPAANSDAHGPADLVPAA